jgi:hypothetical protein
MKLSRKQEEKKREKTNKTIKIVAISVGSTLAASGLIIGILFACGAFDYIPERTYHASIEIENYGTLHVELYGNEAPKTVEHFVDLAKSGYFVGKSLHTLTDGMLYGGSPDADGGSKGMCRSFLGGDGLRSSQGRADMQSRPSRWKRPA